ncbi:hypothetical protein BOH66_02585 [Microbacterium aurum]|uniref:Type I restriction modification DNA specificity domain-containing protein n=1 Tax=Microbacterium aurum TaxID=36805 RepID=A0A1P8U5C4_9MICO|nr:restriction endonuclease subunit S [Microbacterium aurum]APZ33297.1 hypothetical protein BOH66_02585 [Microbacterium aurum]MBM7826917.1 type I restriction enzyme S subunit [Microbacterium aurum]
MSGVPLRYAARILAGQSPDSGAVELLDEGLPFLQGNAEFGAQHPTARWESASAPKVAEAGDVLVSVRAPVGAVNLADQRYGIGRGLCAIRPHTGPSRYFYWWLLSSAEELNSVATGSTFAAVSASDLAALLVPVADETQQAQIADYLDRETAEIDAFIADQEELIGLLIERQDSTWQAAIDGMAAPEVPLRRTIDSIVDGPFGSSLTSAHYSDHGARVVRLGNIGVNAFKEEDEAYISMTYFAELQSHAVERGDVVIAGLGDERMPLGRAAVIPELGPALVKADCYRLRPNRLMTAEFLAWVLSAPQTRGRFGELSRGSTRQRLNTSIVGDVMVPLPSISEQQRVVLQTSEQMRELDAAIADAREAIALSKERRAALISAAVTGKIDVRGTA